MKKISEQTWIPISLAITLALGFSYVKGIAKDVEAANMGILRHEEILKAIPLIQQDISAIKTTQEEVAKRLDRISDYLRTLKR